MTAIRSPDYFIGVVQELRKLPKEIEWVEFKENKAYPPEMIGEYLSALSNGAALAGKVYGYLVWGVEDETRAVVGTTFDPGREKVGKEELENWLLQRLEPKINFRFVEITINDQRVVLLEVGRAFRHPVKFLHEEYIRIGSYKKKLKGFPERERDLWRVLDETPFEKEVAVEHVSADEVLRLIDYPAYFDLLHQPLPDNKNGILEALSQDDLIVPCEAGDWNITNLAAILFAKKLDEFRTVKRKAMRVVVYKGDSRVETVREQEGGQGLRKRLRRPHRVHQRPVAGQRGDGSGVAQGDADVPRARGSRARCQCPHPPGLLRHRSRTDGGDLRQPTRGHQPRRTPGRHGAVSGHTTEVPKRSPGLAHAPVRDLRGTRERRGQGCCPDGALSAAGSTL